MDRPSFKETNEAGLSLSQEMLGSGWLQRVLCRVNIFLIPPNSIFGGIGITKVGHSIIIVEILAAPVELICLISILRLILRMTLKASTPWI